MPTLCQFSPGSGRVRGDLVTARGGGRPAGRAGIRPAVRRGRAPTGPSGRAPRLTAGGRGRAARPRSRRARQRYRRRSPSARQGSAPTTASSASSPRVPRYRPCAARDRTSALRVSLRNDGEGVEPAGVRLHDEAAQRTGARPVRVGGGVRPKPDTKPAPPPPNSGRARRLPSPSSQVERRVGPGCSGSRRRHRGREFPGLPASVRYAASASTSPSDS